MAELIYLQQLYPERAKMATRTMLSWIERIKQASGPSDIHTRRFWTLDEHDLVQAVAITRDHLASIASDLTESTDLLGLTTSYGQLFSSLCLARALKKKNSSLRIVLGGWAASLAGPSLITEYPFIDYVVAGEGELRLLHLMRCLLDGRQQIDSSTGILTRENIDGARYPSRACVNPASLEITDLNELPLPDYDEYYRQACNHGILMTLPIEGARGCWWDKRVKTGDPSQACAFCGLNNRVSRRDKSNARITRELNQLSTRYQSTRFFFNDTVIRASRVRQLAESIRSSQKSYWFSVDIRSGITAGDLASIKAAGCRHVEMGIEGLSSTYLTRLHKGTNTIRNLYTMKACYELELSSASNLIINFPGATSAEVEETRFNILNYAIFYTPLSTVTLYLDPNGTMFLQPDEFGVKNIRMDMHFRRVLPADVSSRLNLPWLDFDVEGEPADWKPVREACKTWYALHRRVQANPPVLGIAKTFFYLDGVDFLELIDVRDGIKTVILKSLWREMYLYCMEIRSLRQIIRRFCKQATKADLVNKTLGPLVDKRLMFKENDQYLSLAVAYTPAEAIQRMRSLSHPCR